jgi:ADP-ribose pyrophosphatase YjhB (NUDIX family)
VLRGTGASREVLILRRGQQLKTCPGAWGLVGEHSNEGEPWAETDRRAMQEELQVFNAEEPVPLVNGSLLVQCDYPELGKKELQATGLFAAQIPSGTNITFDSEVADTKWVRTTDLAAFAMPGRFCNDEIAALGRVVADRLALLPP